VLFVPDGGGPPTRSVRKELLAFLTGVVHGDRLAAEPAELTEDQLECGAARLPGLLLIDSHDQLRWIGAGCAASGPSPRAAALPHCSGAGRLRGSNRGGA